MHVLVAAKPIKPEESRQEQVFTTSLQEERSELIAIQSTNLCKVYKISMIWSGFATVSSFRLCQDRNYT